jgi:hypothetical protein
MTSTEDLLCELFPQLQPGQFAITSPVDEAYNCIAWAVGDTTQVWWPTPGELGGTYWPDGSPLIESIDAFRHAFATAGFEDCDHGELEEGLEKIAVFCDRDGRPTHAARQLPDGAWTSKCGRFVDIRHEDLDGVGGEATPNAYGFATHFMSRPTEPDHDSPAEQDA